MDLERYVAFLTSSMRLSGGGVVLVQRADGLVARGYRVAFVTSAGEGMP